MNQLFALLAPMGLVLSGALSGLAGAGGVPAGDVPAGGARALPAAIRSEADHQVRIEQHFSIRITPGGSPPMLPPDLLDALQEDQVPPHFEPRKVGRCVPIGAIAGVRAGDGDRLLLFMRDQQIITATLGKSCHARDFYSGFYVERNGDGLLCVGRDVLQARSGTNCKVKTLRGMVGAPTRHFP